ncbi:MULTISPECIES: 3-(3-hydroxy-phenyl)propionate transporter MhpT [Acinetobacter]|uniref:3-(3-hydroxy-phenyl)propionate transporter MhpT n=1 Tax=Acinetobacter TaxID=469 RepID=UPI000C2322F9|nr:MULTISPECIES: 3-(3-hydroxy-phenyl)propionate transporter MhpT [Acinetobacter]MDH5820552.1 3-(3-hydroxy-phenyl)propionate transporter MhpT [Acinetobacter pseudolwoffii]MDM1324850.1 3-(3-hydroxy-phenyl)propionate transporter MhpT [Acinetobacter pseudolwoffii]MDM1335166.1 3-(3-hydroxy-phenyl)propionate transporter MhpT [Acinetobacter pseudolwoffii]MEE1124284.1 3-(3-hydroxy-phenyl)propionate transporter MhpT [Acinetobacter pseudolwoffii]PJI34913.1 3-(3-hydroxy-phenyl)propionate transporter MhpT
MEKSDNKHAIVTVAICFLIAVIEGLDIQAAGIAAAGVREHFGLDSSQLGVFFSAGILGLLPGALIGGRFADRIGRKKVLIWSTATFAIFTLCTVWVNSFNSLLAVRFLAGAGLGGAMPILITLASEAVSPQNRGRAVGLMYCGMPVGAAILSLIAATEFGANWKNVFYLGGLLPIFAIPLMMLFLPESKEYLKTQNKTAAELAVAPQGSFKDLFNSDNLLRTMCIWISYFFTLMVVYIMLSWLPSLFMELGFTRKDGSTAQFYFMVTATIGTIILGMLTDRWKKAYVILLMYGGILAGLLALNGASSLNQMYMAAALAGAFVIGCQGVLYAFGSIVYPTEVRGTGVGVASAVGRIGAMLGPVIAGQLLVAGFGAAGVITAAIPCIIISALCMLFLVNRTKV